MRYGHRKPPASSFAEALRQYYPQQSANPYERRLQDPDIPRCPLCQGRLEEKEMMTVVRVYGMIAFIHKACELKEEGSDDYCY